MGNFVFQFLPGLLGFLSIPLLVVLYKLRNRYQPRQVSSLFLWKNQIDAFEGGKKLDPFRSSLLFFLEALTLCLLTLAAATPGYSTLFEKKDLLVVLDDSYSMLAGGKESARAQALVELQRELAARPNSSITLILAGEKPELLGRTMKNADAIQPLLDQWTCQTAGANVPEALKFARDLAGWFADILVVTDQAPSATVPGAGIKWLAFGTPRPNVAFTNAHVTRGEGKNRVLIELENLSGSPAKTTFTLRGGSPAKELQRFVLELDSHDVKRWFLEYAADEFPIRGTLDPDSLDIDNSFVLLARPPRPIRAELNIRDPYLHSLMERTLYATGKSVICTSSADIAFLDETGESLESGSTWTFRFFASPKPLAFLGPFVIDRSHPLAEGLSLNGVVWAASGTADLSEKPVIAAGNVPLLAEAETSGGHHLKMQYVPALSTLHLSPDWPIFFWNLMTYVEGNLPGLLEENLHLGETARFHWPAENGEAEVINPDGRRQSLKLREAVSLINCQGVGVYTVKTAADAFPFAVNAFSRTESDLSHAGNGVWGTWIHDEPGVRGTRDIGWIFILLGLACLILHQGLLFSLTRRKAGAA